MKLKKLKLENFRSYKNLEIEFDDNMNVIIGRNDVGKSTVMEALEIFFNNDLVKIQQDDLNIYAKEEESYNLSIALSFEIENTDTIVIDSSNPTDLKDEFLLDNYGLLTLIKNWDCKTPLKASSLKYYLECEYPSIWKDKPKINLKITDLKKEIKSLLDNEVVTEDIYSKIPQNSNAPMRLALYNHLLEDEDKNDKSTIFIDLNKGDESKSLRDNINKNLPLFFLFQSDRPNRDSDKDVQNPLNIAITKALLQEEIQEKLNDVERLMKEQIKDVADKTLDKLNEMDPNIASTLIPDYTKDPDWKSVFKFSFTGNDIPLNKRGSGVRRLVLLNYFRAEAERRVDDRFNKSVIYAIEEPETSQHPDYQKMLIEALLELSNHEHHQVIITTHTPNIAKMVNMENVILLIKDSNNQIKKFIDDNEKLIAISDTLGLLPYFNNKVVICLEGEFDIKFIMNLNQAIQEYKDIIDLSDETVSLIPLQGGNLKNWVNRNYLKDSNVTEIHIYDSDKGSSKNANQYKKQQDEINSREDSSYCFLTSKREMENYINKDLIESEFSISCDPISNWDEHDIPTFILNKSSYTDEKAIKGILNGKLSKQITKQHLEELEAFEEIREWFEKIKEATKS